MRLTDEYLYGAPKEQFLTPEEIAAFKSITTKFIDRLRLNAKLVKDKKGIDSTGQRYDILEAIAFWEDIR